MKKEKFKFFYLTTEVQLLKMINLRKTQVYFFQASSRQPLYNMYGKLK